ncbi:hypothetical protein ACJX0J_031727, partial [Zea mays]
MKNIAGWDRRATQDKGTCDDGRYTGLSEEWKMVLFVVDAINGLFFCGHGAWDLLKKIIIKDA